MDTVSSVAHQPLSCITNKITLYILTSRVSAREVFAPALNQEVASGLAFGIHIPCAHAAHSIADIASLSALESTDVRSPRISVVQARFLMIPLAILQSVHISRLQTFPA